MADDKLFNRFKPNVYFKPDSYLNGWAKKTGWKAALVYDSLWRHSNKYGHSFPSLELIASEFDVSVSTIQRGLKALIKYNLVKVRQGRNDGGKYIRNYYTLTDKDDWRDPEDDRRSHRPAAPEVTQTGSRRSHSPHKDTHMKDTHIIPKGITESSGRGTKVIAGNTKKTYGNPSVNEVISYFKQALKLPILDKSEKQNRRYAHLLLGKFGGLGGVKKLIDFAAEDDFWASRMSSCVDLYYKGVQIISKRRGYGNKTSAVEAGNL